MGRELFNQPTGPQKVRYLLWALRFFLPFGGALAALSWTLAGHVTEGPALMMYALSTVTLAALAGYGAVRWGGSMYDAWPGITVRCKPGAFVDDRTVIRSIQVWPGHPKTLQGMTLVVYPGEPPEAPLRGGPASQEYGKRVLYTGADAFNRQSHMNDEYDKFVESGSSPSE